MKTITQVSDIVDAVLYLTRAKQVSGEILYVDGGSHAGAESQPLSAQARRRFCKC
jgi:enoyl-[acyl-carrier-protein] reductase (NADH)